MSSSGLVGGCVLLVLSLGWAGVIGIAAMEPPCAVRLDASTARTTLTFSGPCCRCSPLASTLSWRDASRPPSGSRCARPTGASPSPYPVAVAEGRSERGLPQAARAAPARHRRHQADQAPVVGGAVHGRHRHGTARGEGRVHAAFREPSRNFPLCRRGGSRSGTCAASASSTRAPPQRKPVTPTAILARSPNPVPSPPPLPPRPSLQARRRLGAPCLSSPRAPLSSTFRRREEPRCSRDVLRGWRA